MSEDVRSPCINVCQLTPDRRFCIGCGRTPAEIAAWLQAGQAERLAIRRLAAARLAAPDLNKD